MCSGFDLVVSSMDVRGITRLNPAPKVVNRLRKTDIRAAEDALCRVRSVLSRGRWSTDAGPRENVLQFLVDREGLEGWNVGSSGISDRNFSDEGFDPAKNQSRYLSENLLPAFDPESELEHFPMDVAVRVGVPLSDDVRALQMVPRFRQISGGIFPSVVVQLLIEIRF